MSRIIPVSPVVLSTAMINQIVDEYCTEMPASIKKIFRNAVENVMSKRLKGMADLIVEQEESDVLKGIEKDVLIFASVIPEAKDADTKALARKILDSHYILLEQQRKAQ